MQKKEDKIDTVHQKATRDQTMCPIQAGAELVRQIRSYPNTDDDDRIKNHKCHGRGRAELKADEVGTHSLRSAADIAMFLGGFLR